MRKAASTRGLFFIEKSDCQQSKGACQSAKLVNSLCVDMLVVGLYSQTALPEPRDCQFSLVSLVFDSRHVTTKEYWCPTRTNSI